MRYNGDENADIVWRKRNGLVWRDGKAKETSCETEDKLRNIFKQSIYSKSR